MQFTEVISFAGYAIEGVGVSVVIIGSILSSLTYLRSFRRLPADIAYQNFRRQLGRSIILGLEFLIAGDIIRTVIVEATLPNVAVLAIIVIIRTFLGMTLHLEIEGRWPWQTEQNSQ